MSAVTGAGVVRLRHVRLELALHQLAEGVISGPGGWPLLLLHGLGERTPAAVPPGVAGAWPGPVWGLDLTGHGDSDVPVGGGYTCEQLMGDVDVALAHLGPATVLGRGLGAYVALLVAGARPSAVRGAVLADGPGLDGGGTGPVSTHVTLLPELPAQAPDPFALAELSRDLRPPDYATAFARQALQRAEHPTPLVVAARARPPWLAAVAAEPDVAEVPEVADALALVAGGGPTPG